MIFVCFGIQTDICLEGIAYLNMSDMSTTFMIDSLSLLGHLRIVHIIIIIIIIMRNIRNIEGETKEISEK